MLHRIVVSGEVTAHFGPITMFRFEGNKAPVGIPSEAIADRPKIGKGLLEVSVDWLKKSGLMH